MLSFLRDENIKDLAEQNSQPGQDAKPKTEQDQQYLTVSARSSSVRKTTRLLAVLFVVGLVLLVFMIKKSAPSRAAAADDDGTQTQIEKALSRLTGIKAELFGRMDQIVKKFYEFSNVQQVNVNELTKNPFMQDTLWAKAPEEPQYDSELLRHQQLRRQASQMQLLSIMHSPQGNCCMIDDKILYQGDSISGFTVREIASTYVRLASERSPSDRVEIVLELAE